MKKLFILFVMVAGFATITMAQTTGTSSNAGTTSTITTATTGAKILVPIILSWDDVTLEYGEVVIQNVAQGGSIKIVPVASGLCATSSPVNCVSSGVNIIPTIPTFDVSGTQNTLYTITTPADDAAFLTHSIVNTNKLYLTGFNIYCASSVANPGLSATNVVNDAKTDVAGADSWQVGATLNFIAGQASGLYTGTYTVIADYN